MSEGRKDFTYGKTDSQVAINIERPVENPKYVDVAVRLDDIANPVVAVQQNAYAISLVRGVYISQLRKPSQQLSFLVIPRTTLSAASTLSAAM